MEYVYQEENDVWGFPQLYKGIKFYPIKLKDLETKKLFHEIFCYPKEYIKEKEIIKTSYFKYILYIVPLVTQEESDRVKDKIVEFFKIITKIEDISIVVINLNQTNPTVDSVLLKLQIGESSFFEEDFDKIREMVLKQNGLSVRYIEDFDPSLEEKLNWMNRKTQDSNYEDEIFTFCALSGNPITDESFNEMTIYQFKKTFQRLALLLDYENLYPLEISGQIKSKNGKEITKHYLSHLGQEGRYDSILISKNEFIKSNPIMKDDNLENKK